VAIDQNLFCIVVIDVLLNFNLAAILDLFYFLFRLLQLIEIVLIYPNRRGAANCSPYFFFLNIFSVFSTSNYIDFPNKVSVAMASFLQLTDRGEWAWSQIIHQQESIGFYKSFYPL
jgi:hypothetical protein